MFYRFWSIRHAESERMYAFVMGSITGDCYQITAPYLQLCEATVFPHQFNYDYTHFILIRKTCEIVKVFTSKCVLQFANEF